MIDVKPVASPDRKDFKAPPKYRASITNCKEIGADKIASIILNSCTLVKATVLAVLAALLVVVYEMLSLGHTIILGNLGRFQLTLSGETKYDISVEAIKNTCIRFSPGASIKRSVGDPTLLKVH